jgi:glycosyltransferase involved in cell wall biosynthesis
MEEAFSSADVYVQSSRREVCGISVLEALASGLPTVLSDIPPWRMIAAATGSFFPVGDPEGLARALEAADRSEGVRARTHADFLARLSFPALARRIDAVYREVLAERRATR